MRVRKQDGDGDMTFGQGGADYFVDEPSAVGQRIMTRLGLIMGEWFLDTTAGTAWGKIVGRNNAATYDAEIKRVILGTQGVASIVSYASDLTAARKLTITATVATTYGTTETVTISKTLAVRTA